ncbi:cell wall hydrolase [Paracoccus jiaweipingae]|uniref:cell wall hydrolase n=1 Tax=unclassified Paracoccus (in: a-proteobacteria) TaxID=2688777 RepID=UPI00378B054B
MRYLPDWIARLTVCVAVALPVLAPASASAESTRTASYEQRLSQYKARNAARMVAPRSTRPLYVGAAPARISAAAAGPEQLYRASANAAGAPSSRELQCMTEALYFEARGEPRAGQRAVAEVILNRVDSGRFPDNVCGVVNQRGQFSYTIGGSRKIRNKSAYMRVRAVAMEALSGAPRSLTNGATYFHTPQVRPSWSRRFTRTTRIGSHIFYRQGRQLASN